MFVVVGSQIGVLATIGLVLASGVIGILLLRVQGLGALSRIRAETEAGQVPGRDVGHAVMILLAGILLLLPGFLTDILGLLLFVPPIRDFIWNASRSRVTVVATANRFGSRFGDRRGRAAPEGFADRPSAPRHTPVIDLDKDDFERKPDPDSPWRKGSAD